MSINRAKIIKYILIFLAVMLFFTLISNKVLYMMTPEVMTAKPRPARIGYEIYARGTYREGAVTFLLGLSQEAYLEIGDEVSLRFANVRGETDAPVVGKAFDEEMQAVSVTAALADENTAGIYDGQYADVTFFFLKGNYAETLPRDAVIYDGNGAFVYTVQSIDSALGGRQIVRRRDVTVLDEDEFNIAVEGNFNTQDLIAYAFTKPLRDEASVRVVQ